MKWPFYPFFNFHKSKKKFTTYDRRFDMSLSETPSAAGVPSTIRPSYKKQKHKKN